MSTNELLQASTRVALAAYLHDLGKFAERAKIEEAKQTNQEGVSKKDIHTQMYCPKYNDRYSHIHAAYTAIAFGILEPYLPDIKKQNCAPFASWSGDKEDLKAGNSLINAAAMHHKPETFLHWIIAAGDRLASGFERTDFDEYNQAEDESQNKVNNKQARQHVLFENISLDGEKSKTFAYRYSLKPLSPESIFPVKADIEKISDSEAVAEYQTHWNSFLNALSPQSIKSSIPESHKKSLSLWLDHFDTLWQTFAHCIPSATAAKVNNKFISIPADISLYDHSKTTAAIATSLWQYHHHHKKEGEDFVKDIKSDAAGENSEEKFLLIQGDLFGIQNFIFNTGSETTKYAAKLMRGRSFYVSLLTECAALKILAELSLPSTNQIINAAGKFLILAPNTQENIEKIEKIKTEINNWFIDNSYGIAGIGIAYIPASSQDFTKESFNNLTKKLFESLEKNKYQRLNICGQQKIVFEDYLDKSSECGGVCDLDGISPIVYEKDGIKMGALSRDQKNIGDWLPKHSRIVISHEKLTHKEHGCLETPIFGFYIAFTSDESTTGEFGQLIAEQKILRIWDISLPTSSDTPLWKGYARRNINAYIPVISIEDNYTSLKYKQYEKDLDDKTIDFGKSIKNLNLIACEDRQPIQQDINNYIGISALHTLKGDIDNLGQIFQKGIEGNCFAKMASLSRQVNNFFSVYLPYLCASEFNNTYTVFAGGDDFFLIGPWRSQQKLALRLHQEFKRYVANNQEIHFSAGLFLSKPGLPITQLSHYAEEALEKSKAYIEKNNTEKTKNAITCFGQTLSWDAFTNLFENEYQQLNDLKDDYKLSTGFVYNLINFSTMQKSIKLSQTTKVSINPNDYLWKSSLSYRVARNISISGENAKHTLTEINCKLTKAIEEYDTGYYIPVFNILYQQRD